MKKWFTDLAEDVRVKLIEDHKQHCMIWKAREITDEQAFEDLKETAWSDDGKEPANGLEIKYLQINDDAEKMWRDCNEGINFLAGTNYDIKSVCTDLGINVRYTFKQLLIKIEHLENTIKVLVP